nr:hypothetical protein [Parageobacillus thermoglucosidasius]
MLNTIDSLHQNTMTRHGGGSHVSIQNKIMQGVNDSMIVERKETTWIMFDR